MILPLVVDYFFHDEPAYALVNVHEIYIREAIISWTTHVYLQKN
jgi:hypothetical protein